MRAVNKDATYSTGSHNFAPPCSGHIILVVRTQWKRQLERPRRTEEDNINVDLKQKENEGTEWSH
jgi:hypothetical protein